MAWGFSILAMTGSISPSSSMISRTRSTSEAARTNDSAMKSTEVRSAQRRSSSSFSDSAGTLTATPGQVDALVVADRAADDDLGVDVVAVDLGDAQPDLAVVDQDLVAGRHVTRQAGVRRPAHLGRALDVARGDRERGAGLEHDRAVGERLEPDLGALEVREDRHAVTRLVGREADVAVGRLVVGVGPVAHVEPGDVHAGLDQLTDGLQAAGRRTQRAHDLRLGHAATLASI